MRIITLCNHPFGLPTMQELARAGLLVGVVTSNKQTAFLNRINPVLQQYKIPLLKINKTQFEKKTSAFLMNKKAEVVFVLTFKFKIPAKLLRIPKWGFINFHPGPLPQYRGPDPVFWQIKNQNSVGVLSVHQMDANFDTGPMVSAVEFPLPSEMTHSHFMSEAGYVAVQLAGGMVQLLHQTGQLPKQIQNNTQAKYLKKPTQSDLQIDWQKQTTGAIRALVNACNSAYGGAITFLRKQPLQILQVTPIKESKQELAGTTVNAEATKGWLVACQNGELLRIDIVQSAEGIMTGNRFVAMAGIQLGEKFEYIKN